MAIESAQCFSCEGHASLSEHNARHGWACPHCGQSHWPSSDGWAAPTGPKAATAASGISPTRAAAAGYSATLDLATNKGIFSSPAARFATRLAIVVVAAAAALITRSLFT